MKKITNPRLAVTLLLLGALTLPAAMASAQEHPEHPQDKEHPEHPEEGKKAASLTKEQLADAIAKYVKQDAKAKGGYFLVFDSVANEPLALTLEKVHRERLSSLGDGVYFACADFESMQGTTYDVDVFMKQGKHGLETTEVHVHKVDGEPRYTWKEQGGVWVREEAE